MPEQLQPVLAYITAAFQIDTSMLIQGALIALVLGFIMSGLGQIIYYVLVALVLDLIIVPLGKTIYANEMNFGGAVEYLKEIFAVIMEDPMGILGPRAVFFVVTLLVVRLISSVVRRS